MRARSVALLAAGVAGVSSSAVLIRIADAPALAVGFWRNALAALVLAPFAFAHHRGELRALSGRHRGLIVLSGAMLALHFALWIPSLSLTSVAASTVLVTTTPIWVAMLGAVLLSERVGRRGIAGIALAFTGALVISGGDLGDGSEAIVGDLLALGGALAAAAYVLLGRTLRPRVSLSTYAAAVYAVAAAILGLAMLAVGTPFGGYGIEVWTLFGAMAVGPQLLGHTVFNYLLAEVEAWVVALAVTAEPVGATLLGMVVLHEVPSRVTVAGAAVTLGGIALAVSSASTERGVDREVAPG